MHPLARRDRVSTGDVGDRLRVAIREKRDFPNGEPLADFQQLGLPDHVLLRRLAQEINVEAGQAGIHAAGFQFVAE